MLTLVRSNLIYISFVMPYNSIRKLYVGLDIIQIPKGNLKTQENIMCSPDDGMI